MSRKYNKTFTNLKTVVHDTSILDAQKILVKPFNGQANERTDIIELIHNIENENDINSDRLEVIENEVLGAYVPHDFTTNSTGRSNETEGTAIQLSKAHFIDGGVQIQSLQLPYTLAVGITDQYCHIQFCDTNNEIIKTIVSKNTQSQVSGDTGISTWDFEEDATAPEDYHIARIILSGIKETSAFGTTTLFRINVVNNNGVDFDNDECCVWNGSGTSYNYLGDVSLTYGVHSGTLKSQINEEIQSLNDNISEISDDIDEINNEVSLIEEFKNNTNEKIENIEERIINIEDILDGEFVDKTFTTNTTEDTAETAGRGIQLSKNHFIEGGTILKSLSLPYKGADYTRNNQYCHVTFYDENEQPIKKITSFNTQSRALNASGISKWTFTENNTLPDDYYYAQIALSGSATDNPNIKTGSQCSTYTINVIRKDGNNVTFDDDICQCYGPNGGVMNYLGDVSVEYQGPGPTLAETVSNNESRITVLEENLVTKTDINLPTLSSRWDSDFAGNIGWVKSEGQWLNGNAYLDAYDLMVSKIGENDKFIEAAEGTELTDENADKFLIDTTAVKFRLPLINGERVLVTKYKNGYSWYNWYSDGWIEQGADVGIATSGWGTTSFIFPRKFKDLYYSIHAHGNWSDAESSSCTFTARSVEGATVNYANNKVSIKPTQYEARGFSNIPTILEYNCGNYLFFKLADEVPSTVVNTEQVVADLKQECDDFKAALEEKFNSGAFVIESYTSEDGNSWYRKYSDGWIEQGGKALTSNTYVFPIPFTSIPTFTHGEYNSGGSNSQAVGFCQLTTSGFQLSRYSGGSMEMHWRACGY